MKDVMAGNVRFFSAGPLSVLAIVLLIGLGILLILLLFFGIIGTALTRLGLSWIEALVLVFFMLFGSLINIPLWIVRRDMVRATSVHSSANSFGSPFSGVPPVWDTRISINLGGGIIPLTILIYLLYNVNMFFGPPLLALVSTCAVLVALLTYFATRDTAGVGIRVPVFLPALTALLAGYLLAGGSGLTAAVTALAGGIIGTLTGGNLAHLLRVRELEVSDISIGGSGTFGAVFLCCVLPALIA